MKYFRWSEQEIMNMSYHKFTLYLASIPEYDTDDQEISSVTKATGSFNLFDLDNK